MRSNEPCHRRYRDASDDVFRVLNANFKLVEKASIDEAYLDLTDDVQQLRTNRTILTVDDFPTTHLAGMTTKSEDERIESIRRWLTDHSYDDERQYDLTLGAYLVEQIRKKIKDETGFFCSAGIARNKVNESVVSHARTNNRVLLLLF
jgi:DNA polymerase eta